MLGALNQATGMLHGECRLPLRLRRLQYIDLKSDCKQGLEALLITLVHQEQILVRSFPTNEYN